MHFNHPLSISPQRTQGFTEDSIRILCALRDLCGKNLFPALELSVIQLQLKLRPFNDKLAGVGAWR